MPPRPATHLRPDPTPEREPPTQRPGPGTGRLQSIVEERAPSGPVVVAEKGAAPASADASPPIQPGSETLTVDVTPRVRHRLTPVRFRA
jgi:hypothetical protein